MGKKSKRNRSSGGGAGKAAVPKAPPSPAMLVDENGATTDRPAKKVADSRRNTSTAAAIEEEEETADNLRFQDPYIDEYEEEEAMDEDTIIDSTDEKLPSSAVASRDPHQYDGQDVVRSWNPLTSGPLAPGEKLEVDPTAYKMLHGLTPEWPSLSFDFIRDELGENRTRFPHSAIVAVGSQADRTDRNRLTIMKLSDLARTGVVKSAEEEDDDILGEKYNDSDDDDDESDDESEEEDEEVADLDPVVEHYSLRHQGGINRIRAMPQHPEVVATWSDAGTVNLYDVRGILDTFARSAGDGGGAAAAKFRRDPFFVYQGHSTEGYAMDWSRVKTGQMATGDCDGNIHVWQPASGPSFGNAGGWNNSSFSVSATYGPSGGNIDNPSVEDIQWSPTESTVFATAECGGYVKVFDIRCKDRPMISNKIHSNGADVNVLAWNGLVSNLLATGGDDGVFTVWDLRNFQPASADVAPSPLARFTAHRNPITSLEWHPTDESMIAVSDEAGTYIYDLSIEEDEPSEKAGGVSGTAGGDEEGGGGGEIPPQLLFVHCGSESVKEVHWHPQVASMVMTTALTGFSLFIPSNL